MKITLETNPTWQDLKAHAEAVDKLPLLKAWAPKKLRMPGGASSMTDAQVINRQQAKEVLGWIGIECETEPTKAESEVIFSGEELPPKGEVRTIDSSSKTTEQQLRVEEIKEFSGLQSLVEAISPPQVSRSVQRIDDVVDTISEHRESIATRNILGITVKSQDEAQRIHKYINNEIEYFFHDIVQESPTGYISYDLSIAPVADLKIVSSFISENQQRDWVYDQIFHDFGERDATGKLVRKLKFFVTLDEFSAPIEIKHQGQRGADARRYGTIDVGGGTKKEHRVCYIVYFTLQELLNAMKQK